jgi:hypothetical protein
LNGGESERLNQRIDEKARTLTVNFTEDDLDDLEQWLHNATHEYTVALVRPYNPNCEIEETGHPSATNLSDRFSDQVFQQILKIPPNDNPTQYRDALFELRKRQIEAEWEPELRDAAQKATSDPRKDKYEAAFKKRVSEKDAAIQEEKTKIMQLNEYDARQRLPMLQTEINGNRQTVVVNFVSTWDRVRRALKTAGGYARNTLRVTEKVSQ